jgi:glycolate oxidase FAD binding subunit
VAVVAASNPEEVRRAVEGALYARCALEIVARGSKRALGRPVDASAKLDVSGLAGIVDYDPPELVLTARPGTPIAEIDTALEAAGQMLAFEPPDLGPLLESEAEQGTLGGVLSANLSGPRRLSAGAARDHCLGLAGVTGRAEIFKAGGRVVKNVTGYDVARLLCGAYGTLAVLTEVTVKVVPRPETVRTLVVPGRQPEPAGELMRRAMGSAHDVSSAAHLPAGLAADLDVGGLPGGAVTALRLEGPGPSVQARLDVLVRDLGLPPGDDVLDEAASLAFWRGLRDVAPLRERPDLQVWRISTGPTDGPLLLQALAGLQADVYLMDWAGGLVWLGLPPAADAHAPAVRGALEPLGGHATLIRADADVRREVPVFQPEPQGVSALSARVKASFDPNLILNPGRMVPGR